MRRAVGRVMRPKISTQRRWRFVVGPDSENVVYVCVGRIEWFVHRKIASPACR